MRKANTLVPLQPVERDTIPRIFFGGIDRHHRDQAMMYRAGGKWLTLSHAEIETRVTRLAAALSDLGVGTGSRVVILSENRPEWAIADFAVTGLGAIDVPIYPTLPANQVEYIVRDCGASVVFVSNADQAAKIAEIRANLPDVQHVIAFDGKGEGVTPLDDVLKAGETAIAAGRFIEFRERALALGRDEVATLIYTSGTTGNPKGVMLTHFNLASNVAGCLQHGLGDIIHPGDTTLSFLPLSHVFERMVDYLYWDVGTCTAYTSVDTVADDLGEVRPMIAVSVPRLFEKIYSKVVSATGIKAHIVSWAKGVGLRVADLRVQGRRPSGLLGVQYGIADKLVFSKLRERTGGRLRSFVSGGAPLSPEIARFFLGAGLPVYEGYGLTETSPVIAVNKPDAIQVGSVGRPIPGVEVRIADGSGEILTRGPHVMKGYWNNDEATREAVDADGWFHTGDIGELTDDGFLRITDRLKNIIVTAGGKNVAPAPMENVAVMSPYVSQAVIIGDRRAFPVILVVPEWENLRPWAAQQGITATDVDALAAEPRVREFLEKEALGGLAEYAKYERPKKVAVIAHEFTIDNGMLTPTLKVRRKAVEKEYAAVIEELYAGSSAGKV
ncbi:AMP-dependent synthetase/ligase [Longimicrobium terrae]|uniref:Long-chain acyl-CoA synthetase n=1 Tax=Longimicrobium terrae TaxID=1639882 RepID=A0A841H766_9BACT|nr:long-chain fatty acid--CoA ligase [Longimicrobium terrae]MBB4639571.1 long-chain acyl-CoA synthetase [Longimicrobium terrae]MBB6073970.1 long-chain acyl-CoA synthetase [Longimicrobium terrae]NNC29134.1 long-chain fatty acid--CoA ligase [Longimicrobium terrae]